MSVYLIDINVFAEIDDYPSVRFQDIRKNQSVTDGHTDVLTDGRTYTPTQTKFAGGGVGDV